MVDRVYSRRFLVADAGLVQHRLEQRGRPVPAVLVADVLAPGLTDPRVVRRQREQEARRAHPEVVVRAQDQVQRRPGLVGDLVEDAEDVPVVQLDRADPGQSTQYAGQLGAVHAAELGVPDRELAIAVGARPVDQRVVRTQARPQHHLLLPHLHRWVHVVAVVRPVPGDLVQLALAEHG
jgi:hypothetical protein